MPDQPIKRGRGRPATGRTTRARNLSVTDADWGYLLSRNSEPSKALREVIAEARDREARDLNEAARLVDEGVPIDQALVTVINQRP